MFGRDTAARALLLPFPGAHREAGEDRQRGVAGPRIGLSPAPITRDRRREPSPKRHKGTTIGA